MASTCLLFGLLVVTQTSPSDGGQVHAESVIIRLIDDVEVAAQAPGPISAVNVTEGQYVRKGDRLAIVDDSEARLALERSKIELLITAKRASDDVPVRSAQKALAFAQADVARLRRAAEKLPRSVSKTELEQTQLQADQAVLDLEKARHELELAGLTQKLKRSELRLADRDVKIRQILSPLNGVVVEVLRRPGEWVELGDTVLRIVRMDRLRAEGLVPMAEMNGIVKGAPATLIVDLPGRPNSRFLGEVVFVSPEVNAVNERFRVWAEVDNPQGLLKPGFRARLAIASGRRHEPADGSVKRSSRTPSAHANRRDRKAAP